MKAAIETQRVTSAQLGLAAALFVSVLMIAYGYFHPSKIAFYVGLFLAVGGVITGMLRIVTHASSREPKA
jgi:hypothetical protein